MKIKTPVTEYRYKLAIHGMPYDTSYGSFNFKAWETIQLLKKLSEELELRAIEAENKLKNEQPSLA